MSERVSLEDELTDTVRKLNTTEWERDEAREIAARCYAAMSFGRPTGEVIERVRKLLGVEEAEQYPEWLLKCWGP